MSRPTRARGLKLGNSMITPLIEPSRPTRARGLKQSKHRYAIESKYVAPHAGAWIETGIGLPVSAYRTSRPTRARGLKPITITQIFI